MIDEMVANLKKEQLDDDAKKMYCEKELDTSEDTKKELERSISVSQTAIEDLMGSIATLADEIAALKAAIKALDKSVAEATAIRKEENADYKEVMENNAQVKNILLWAKNRLNQFYDPKMYKAPSAALVQGREHYQRIQKRAAPPPPPETFGPYQKKTEEGHGVIAMIDLLVKDTDTEMTESDTAEKDAQADYETLMAQAGAKRAEDSKASTEKTVAKADAEEALQAEKTKKKNTGVELMQTTKVISSLHAECDWLIQYYDVRKAARTDEIEALGKAKAVLSGADYSLLETAASLRGTHHW